MDFPANPPEKTGYTLEFADEFTGSTLDQTKWFPHMLPHWSSLEASKARYTLENGVLKLMITQDQDVWLKDSDRASNLQTGHFSRGKGSNLGQFRYDPAFRVTQDLPILEHYLPKFGYIETRLKAVPVVGYHVALWLIGFDEPDAGEIRVFEIHGGNIRADRSRIDYGILKWDDPNLVEECYEDVLPINAAEYHIYAIDWTPNHVDFYLDNQKIRRILQSPQYRMQLMLGVYERPHEIQPNDPAPFPRICEIDYLRGYARATANFTVQSL